jgi:hypothetical protein
MSSLCTPTWAYQVWGDREAALAEGSEVERMKVKRVPKSTKLIKSMALRLTSDMKCAPFSLFCLLALTSIDLLQEGYLVNPADPLAG